MKKFIVRLSADEKKKIHGIIHKGKKSIKVFRNALILMNSDENNPHGTKTDADIASFLNVNVKTVEQIRKKYVTKGLHIALLGEYKPKKHIGQLKIDETIEGEILTILSESPPLGKKKWSLRLISETLVNRGLCDTISHEAVRKVIKKYRI